jgi:tRNA G18 (ribose-2'-O)-methylase SpoU
MDIFLEIERYITSGMCMSYHIETLRVLLSIENDTQLAGLYKIIIDDAPEPEIYFALHMEMQRIFQIELSNQKDFHFLQGVQSPEPEHFSHNLQAPKRASTSIILILDNLRSAYNVGAIIRTAECLSIPEIWFCGYTPLPDHPKVANTAMGTQDKINWTAFSQTTEAVKKAKADGYQVIGLETSERAVSIYEYGFPSSIAIIAGNEALGISADVLQRCDAIVNIPITSWKKSLNVATAVAVMGFEIYRRTHICPSSQK